MNTHLVNFYKTWLHWASVPNAHNPAEFDPKFGLCNSLRMYLRWIDIPFHERWDIMLAMEGQFEIAGLSSITPFNEFMYYGDELDKRKNPLRIQFVKDRLAEVEAIPHD